MSEIPKNKKVLLENSPNNKIKGNDPFSTNKGRCTHHSASRFAVSSAIVAGWTIRFVDCYSMHHPNRAK